MDIKKDHFYYVSLEFDIKNLPLRGKLLRMLDTPSGRKEAALIELEEPPVGYKDNKFIVIPSGKDDFTDDGKNFITVSAFLVKNVFDNLFAPVESPSQVVDKAALVTNLKDAKLLQTRE